VRTYQYLAFTKSYKSDVKYRHCAIIFDKNYKIISIFVNKFKHNEIGTIHAEEGAIFQCLKENPSIDISKCTLLVVRSTLDGKHANSAPCDKCVGIMKQTGVKTCLFSNGNGKDINITEIN